MSRVDALATELAVPEVALDTWTFNVAAQGFFQSLGYSAYNLRLRKRENRRNGELDDSGVV
jgi:hypothetical protein